MTKNIFKGFGSSKQPSKNEFADAVAYALVEYDNIKRSCADDASTTQKLAQAVMKFAANDKSSERDIKFGRISVVSNLLFLQGIISSPDGATPPLAGLLEVMLRLSVDEMVELQASYGVGC